MVPSVSIIIPAYNESTRLGRTMGELSSYLASNPTVELLVADDGSTDSTADLAESLLPPGCKARWQVLRQVENRGKGHAVRRGMLAARAPVAVFSDADLSTPLSELPKLVDRVTRGTCDIAFGSRALDRRLIETRQPLYRDFAGRMFNTALRLATGLPFLDTQCGFKAFRMSACRPLFESSTIDGFGFDIELLFVAHRAGLRLHEVPVRWHHEDGSKVRLSRDGPRMLTDIVAVRRQMWRGHYNVAMMEATSSLSERKWAAGATPATLHS